MKTIVAVCLGGALGSVCRYLIASYFAKTMLSAFPYGTFVINIAGCLLIGIFYGLSERYQWFTPQWRIFLTTGFCGGFTTFSSFAYENIRLLQTGNYISFAIYSACSVIVGLFAVIAGIYLAKI